MAFNLPLEIPLGLGFNRKVFELGFYQENSPGMAGFIQTFDRATPMWYAEYTTPPLNNDRENDARGFFGLLEGSIQTFLASDPRRLMPRAYASLPLINDPWTLSPNAAPRVTAFSFVNGTLTFDRFATGAIITVGDYISFKLGNTWYLFRALETLTTISATPTIRVEPRPNLVGTLPVDIRYRRPVCAMKIIGGVKWEDTVDSPPQCSFKAFQFLDLS